MKKSVLKSNLIFIVLFLCPTSTQPAARSSLSLQPTPDDAVAPKPTSEKKRPRPSQEQANASRPLPPTSSEDEKKEQADFATEAEASEFDAQDVPARDTKRLRPERLATELVASSAASGSSSSSLESQKKLDAEIEEKKKRDEEMQRIALNIQNITKKQAALLPNAINAIDYWWDNHQGIDPSAEDIKKEIDNQLVAFEQELTSLDTAAQALLSRTVSQEQRDFLATLVLSPEKRKELAQDIIAYFPQASHVQAYKKLQGAIITKGKQALDKELSSLEGRSVSDDEKKKIVESVLESVSAQLKKLTAEPSYRDLATLPKQVSPMISNQAIQELLFKYAQKSLSPERQLTSLPKVLGEKIQSTIHEPTMLTYLFGIKKIESFIEFSRNDNVIFSEDRSIFIKYSILPDTMCHVYAYNHEAENLEEIFNFPQKERASLALNVDGSVIAQRSPNGQITVFRRNEKGYLALEIAVPDEAIAKSSAPPAVAISAHGNLLLVPSNARTPFHVFLYDDESYKPFFVSEHFDSSQKTIMSGDGSTIVSAINTEGEPASIDYISATTIYKYDGKTYNKMLKIPADLVVDDKDGSLDINFDGSLIFCDDMVSKTFISVYTLTKDSYELLQMIGVAGKKFTKSSNGSTFYIDYNKKQSYLYKLGDDRQFHKTPLAVDHTLEAVSPDGSVFVTYYEEGLFFWCYNFSLKRFELLSINNDAEANKTFYTSNNPVLCISVPHYTDEDALDGREDDETLELFTPVVSKKIYNMLSKDQRELLADLYTAHTARKHPGAINLNEAQTALWQKLPLQLLLALHSNRPQLIIRLFLTPQEAAFQKDLQDFFAAYEKTIISSLKSHIDIYRGTDNERDAQDTWRLYNRLSKFFKASNVVIKQASLPLSIKVEELLGTFNTLAASITEHDFIEPDTVAARAWKTFKKQLYKKLMNAQHELQEHEKNRTASEEKTEKEEKDNKSRHEQTQEESI